MGSLFQLPDELVLTTLDAAFPCRATQIRALGTLLDPSAAPSKNLVLHGTEATGKSAITEALLQRLAQKYDDAFRYAIVNSIECITERHFLERTIARVADALQREDKNSRCDDAAQLVYQLGRMLQPAQHPDGFRFVLVFDAIDRQRDAQPTLIPALARLSEIIPCLTTVFIVTVPESDFLETSFVPHIDFPNYTKTEFVAILSSEAPETLPNTAPNEVADLWARFTAAAYDALTRPASRTLPALKHACHALWPRFTAPVAAGTHSAKEFSKLLIAARVHFQDESLLDPGIVFMKHSTAAPTPNPAMPSVAPAAAAAAATAAGTVRNGDARDTRASRGTANGTTSTPTPKPAAPPGARPAPDLASLLPSTARLLVLAAYLASHNPAKYDLTVFSTFHHGRKRRRGGISVGLPRGRPPKHRKIARKLLGAHAFVLERMMAIFAAVRKEWDAAASQAGGDGKGGPALVEDTDVGMAIATLASLRLLVRVGGAAGGDPMDRGGKWRVNVSWEIVRGLGRSMGIEVEDWLIE